MYVCQKIDKNRVGLRRFMPEWIADDIWNAVRSVTDAFGHQRTNFIARLQDLMSSDAKELVNLDGKTTAEA